MTNDALTILQEQKTWLEKSLDEYDAKQIIIRRSLVKKIDDKNAEIADLNK